MIKYDIVYTKELEDTIIVNSPRDVYQLIKEYANSLQEQKILITMATNRQVIGVHLVHIGSADTVRVSARDIFRIAILDNATSIILCHNHPCGSLIPSISDIANANKLSKIGLIHDIPVQSNLIISKNGYTVINPDNKSLKKFMEALTYDL